MNLLLWSLAGRLETEMARPDWFNQGIGQRCHCDIMTISVHAIGLPDSCHLPNILKATTAPYSSETRKIIASVSAVAQPCFRLPRNALVNISTPSSPELVGKGKGLEAAKSAMDISTVPPPGISDMGVVR